MARFLLNRPDDRDTLSKGRIIANMLIWLVILYAGYVALYVICMGIYGAIGVIPTKLTDYAADPSLWTEQPLWQTILWALMVGPLSEELMFRLGLSFKRLTVGLWAGLLPIVLAGYVFLCRVWYILMILAIAGGLIFWLIYRYTTDEQWKTWRKKYIMPAMWVSAIGFGLFHLNAFTVLNWQVLPFALVTILAYGRWLRLYIRKGQSGILVGRPASLRQEPALCVTLGLVAFSPFRYGDI